MENENEAVETAKRKIAADLPNVRFSMLRSMPFIGDVAMRFDLVPVRDARVATACTDGRSIYFDCEFYASLTAEERVFVMAHEVWHCALLHFGRRQTRDPGLFNVASDMEVNHMLASETYSPPAGLCFPPSGMEGSSAEELYEWLKANGVPSSAESGSGLSGQFDGHCFGGETQEDAAGGRRDRWGEVGNDPDFRPSVPRDVAERMREAVVSAAQRIRRERGSLPAGVEGILDRLYTPEVRWQEVLAQFVTASYGDRLTWLPPNRRRVHDDMYFQSRSGGMIKGVVAIDTSGSCVEDLPKFFGELKGLVDSFGSYRVKVLQADAEVDSVEDYDEFNPMPDNPEVIEWKGGGGTDYDAVFRYIDENMDEPPDFLVYLGDGYANLTVPEPPYPVLWFITKDGTTDFVEWGRKHRFRTE